MSCHFDGFTHDFLRGCVLLQVEKDFTLLVAMCVHIGQRELHVVELEEPIGLCKTCSQLEHAVV